MKSPQFLIACIVALATFATASGEVRDVAVTLRARTANGSPIAGVCLYVLQTNFAYGCQADDAGNATVVVPVGQLQTELVAGDSNRGLPVVWANGEQPACSKLMSSAGGLCRFEFTQPIAPTDLSAVFELRLVDTVKATLKVVDAAGQPQRDVGAYVVGFRTAALSPGLGTLRFDEVPKGQPFRVAIRVGNERFFREYGPLPADADLGEVQITPDARTARVKLTYSKSSDSFQTSMYGSFTLVSVDGARAIEFRAVQGKGVVGGPQDGEFNLVPPGDYFVVPGSIVHRPVVDLIDKLREGNAAATGDLTQLQAVAGESRSIHIVVDQEDRAVRKAVGHTVLEGP